ncbi:hypothetical protein SAMN05192575_107201 [Nocardioides alpinus]|uniref:Uncharacterized protein n=2 Tax=Nocardioides alpinus TaxID=748909 RepID=A0A1I1A3Z3_9ACTN|nr:hypothetical protein [Nocardioides alpinus]SFB32647.1 hypothetical protein SAMN05192575_107201 [Nocardioides alpinus]
MRLPSLRRPSPSMAVSIMALVVASTGTSYAAGLIGSDDVRNNSLTTMDIKDKTIKGRDIKNDVIGSNKIRNGSLKSRDFKAGQLPAGATGPAGPAGVGRWALVDATGAIIAQSGGFTVAAGYPAAPAAANGNVYINAGENLSNNGVIATIALQNTADLNADGILNGRQTGSDSNPEFSGEVSAAVCTPGVVNCAPAGTGNPNHLVVSPRNSDGSFTTDGARKRFYVVVTGDSSDRG